MTQQQKDRKKVLFVQEVFFGGRWFKKHFNKNAF